MIDFESIKAVDPEICDAMRKELTRQREHLELIASENFVSDAVLSAMGSHLTNKYAEGYPGKRYYGACQYVDIVEDLARQGAFRGGTRQRAAPFRRAGQYGGLFCHA